MKPKVSISVTTFNQEKYIEQTLDSLLMQRTDFLFEILINDDASIDKSPEIIAEYEKKYPNIIKPIYQKENQYTQGKEVHYTFNYTRAQGKYIAYCDGDDYWTDPFKLQKQYDFMEKHAHVSACVHAGKSVNEKGTRILWIQKAAEKSCYLDTDKVIASQGKFASNSLFMRNYFAEDYEMPGWYHAAKITDYPLYLILSTKGFIYYMEDVMCSFRVGSSGSFTQLVLNDPSKKTKHLYEMVELLELFNKATHFKHSSRITDQIDHNLYDYVAADLSVRQSNPALFQSFYEDIPSKDKIRLYLKHYSPKLVAVIKKIKEPVHHALKPREKTDIRGLWKEPFK